MTPRLTLDSAALERVFSAWSVPVPSGGLVLFALRGATPVKTMRGWTRSVSLTLTPVDHIHMRCTIGIWDRARGRVFAATGSTVPHHTNVLKAAARAGVMKGRGTNQLEPGYYTDLTKGEHLQGKPQGHAALRQTGYRFYRRAHLAGNKAGQNLPLYTNRDPLYFGNPYDNLHCAWNPEPKAEGFRSAGCVVVSGWPHSPRLPDAQPNQGAWKIFHDLIYAAPQTSFPFLLLPGEEVAEALSSPPTRNPSKGTSTGTARLVYGSEGEAVKALQKTLAKKGLYHGAISGRMGVATYRAWKGRI